MLSDKVKQQARLSILERLKQKGMPRTDMSPVPAPISEEVVGSESPEETLNDMGITPSLSDRIKPKKKKRPGMSSEPVEASTPINVTGSY